VVRKNCKQCGKPLKLSPYKAKEFCNRKCETLYKESHNLIKKKCIGCGCIFEVDKAHRHQKYHSDDCYHVNKPKT